jgi:glycosyltransferase involved in cell wall biosynthesis
MACPAQATRGVFVNPALQEPFGLTIIEVRAGDRGVAWPAGVAWLWHDSFILLIGWVGGGQVLLCYVSGRIASLPLPAYEPATCLRVEFTKVHKRLQGLPSRHRYPSLSQNASCHPQPLPLLPLQAAAHGVPTVATKNGGPVDIMDTLHHGVTVDPTNSAAIADALLKILTNPQVGGCGWLGP